MYCKSITFFFFLTLSSLGFADLLGRGPKKPVEGLVSNECLWPFAWDLGDLSSFCHRCALWSHFLVVCHGRQNSRGQSPCPVLVLPLTSCVTVSYWYNFSGPPISPSIKWGDSSLPLTGLLAIVGREGV